jgi:ABC-2 type transport system ATP-binding protein
VVGVPAAIETRALTKFYGRQRGIVDLDLAVQRGEIFGFLGPNGAGKTTTIRTLLGFLHPTSGSATILGHDASRRSIAVRAVTGYLPAEVSLYPWMTGRELVEFALNARRCRAGTWLETLKARFPVDLDRRIRAYSRGLRQQLAVIAALAHDPELLILDEPTTGLDPLLKASFQELLGEERDRGKTIFLSSHILPEVEEVCDRVGIIREGRLVAVEEVSGLRQRRFKRVKAFFPGNPPDFAALPGVLDVHAEPNGLAFQVQGDIRPVLAALGQSNVTDVEITDPTLEEIFLQFYGTGAGAAAGPAPVAGACSRGGEAGRGGDGAGGAEERERR